jgi:hypothetical protein
MKTQPNLGESRREKTIEKKNNTIIPVPIESSYLSIGRKLPTIRDGLYKFISQHKSQCVHG